MLETLLKDNAGKLQKLALPIEKDKDIWCTLGGLTSKHVSHMQVLCCAEPVTLKPNGLFSPCSCCGHGYMIRDGYHDDDHGHETHMHFFHKQGPIGIQIVGTNSNAPAEQDVTLNVAFGTPSGSSGGIYFKGELHHALITCCKTPFQIELDQNENKGRCPDCATYGYSMERSKKTIIRWYDRVQQEQRRLNKKDYETRVLRSQSTRTNQQGV